ncbi:MAG: hypothetical protein AVDCRST_MAG58-2340 [uncultured Rubrobacteraceae bacterium]|uniref:Uncharacterized protein n=1 Tax=uncultured Rubrobacteraceae bacterium TaxID=349277 RepID=A0A6J4QZD7_9ACTN|nr:MAG: hypothetical protein AVDCRST_MAG58-2340 [uncultured Rubrobacteraceae bacterium]
MLRGGSPRPPETAAMILSSFLSSDPKPRAELGFGPLRPS